MFQSELVEPKWEDSQVHLLNELFVDDSARELLLWALEIFSPSLYFECQFNLEDLVILELFNEIGQRPTIFYIDTGKLPHTTHELIRRYEDLGFDFLVYHPNSVEESHLQRSSRTCKENQSSFNLCSYTRLEEPRKRALENAQGWISAKAQQKSHKPLKVQVDHKHNGIIRINPLSDWSKDEVWKFIDEKNLPYNPLHSKGVRSIGCQTCSFLP